MFARIAAFALSACAGVPQGLPTRPPITVSAAVSLTDVLMAEAQEYARTGGGNVRFNFGASNVLARQIASGAPVDLFISADQAQMDVVAAAGAIGGTRVDLLYNQLAVVVPSDRPRTLRSVRELADPAFKRIAIGDPQAVPAGVYAKQYLQQVGIWDAVQQRIVPSASVRAALSAVETGAVDAAIVYRTDARISTRASAALVGPLADGPRIVYPAAITKSAEQPAEASRFLDFLRSGKGRLVFERFGFTPVS